MCWVSPNSKIQSFTFMPSCHTSQMDTSQLEKKYLHWLLVWVSYEAQEMVNAFSAKHLLCFELCCLSVSSGRSSFDHLTYHCPHSAWRWQLTLTLLGLTVTTVRPTSNDPFSFLQHPAGAFCRSRARVLPFCFVLLLFAALWRRQPFSCRSIEAALQLRLGGEYHGGQQHCTVTIWGDIIFALQYLVFYICTIFKCLNYVYICMLQIDMSMSTWVFFMLIPIYRRDQRWADGEVPPWCFGV